MNALIQTSMTKEENGHQTKTETRERERHTRELTDERNGERERQKEWKKYLTNYFVINYYLLIRKPYSILPCKNWMNKLYTMRWQAHWRLIR